MMVGIAGDQTMLRHVTLCGCLCFAAAANAEGIHKCVTRGGTVYQGSPCAGAEAPLSIALAPAMYVPAAPEVPATPDCASAGGPPARPPWRHGAICIGMSDDEVLNLAGWGRPARIIRKRTHGGWEEDWTYDERAANAATLRFVNARLAAVETDPPRVLVASAPLAHQ
jgi:hypothetical protein